MTPIVNPNLQALQQLGSKPTMTPAAPIAVPTAPIKPADKTAAKPLKPINPEVQKKLEAHPNYKAALKSVNSGPMGLVDAMKKFHASKKINQKTKE